MWPWKKQKTGLQPDKCGSSSNSNPPDGITKEPDKGWEPVHVLYPRASSDNKNFNFDIILFHSLERDGSDTLWRSTWESPIGAGGGGEDRVLWPAVWLPEDLDGIRVLSVSYHVDETKIFGMENIEVTIEDIGENFSKIMELHGIGQRRFVSVGHGFGGLVIKSLISEMKRLSHIPMRTSADKFLQSTAEKFLNHLRGIFYYAVPHRNVGAFLKRLQRDGISRSEEPGKNLELRMAKLGVMTSDALLGRRINLSAVGEGKPTNGKLVVQLEDAMLDVGNHYYRLEDCSHHEVCKPKHKGHESYKKLLELLTLSGAGKNEVWNCTRIAG